MTEYTEAGMIVIQTIIKMISIWWLAIIGIIILWKVIEKTIDNRIYRGY